MYIVAQQQRQHCWHNQPHSTFPKRSIASSSRKYSITRSAAVAVHSLPRIADFIRDECPIRGLDGTFREQPARPGTELQDSCVVQMHEESLLVPGQRQLMYVQEDQLDRIIQDQGRAVLACLQNPTAGTIPKLLSPARGSWAVAAAVGGVQRLPGSNRALIRLLVTDRVAVQALDSPSLNLVLARSAQLRDRWCYFVRTAALEQHLGGSSDGSSSDTSTTSDTSSGSSSSSNGSNGAGRDVLNAVQQVQDAATELLQLLQQMYCTIQQVTDSSSSSSSLQQLLQQHEAAEELAELLCWCEMQQDPAAVDSTTITTTTTSSSSSSTELLGADGLLPADWLLMERAWRLSFAPFAAKGLAAALGVDVETGKSSSVSSSSSEVLEMMDLGLRLEAAWELGQALRQKLAARLSLGRL